jgi:protein-tyrosine phosphatase
MDPGVGKLALAARPRGGEWLPDEMAHWRQDGVDTVVSLLTAEEEASLDLKDEATQALAHGIDFIPFPIPDREVPDSESAFTHALCRVDAELANGRNVVLHCRQGIGRTGLFAAGLFLAKGFDPDAAVKLLSAARGIPVPETPGQRRWLERYASQFAVVR